jgi:hypothetical protein
MKEAPKLTRAEAVRQRRIQRGTQRLSQAGEHAHRPLLTVTTRTRGSVLPASQTLESMHGVQSAVAIPRPKTEARGLSLPRPGQRTVPLMLSLAFALTIYLALNLEFFRVATPLISGNARLRAEQVSAVLAATGQPIFALRPDELTARLRLNFPELASAELKVYLPNKVWVRLAERSPLILWQEGEGYTWIDSSGIAFRPRGEAAGLITVQAASSPPAGSTWPEDPLSPPAFLAPKLVEAVIALAPAVPVDATMTYDAHNGLGWKDPRGWQVAFGSSAKDINLKMRVYQTLAESLSARSIFPEFVSVVYPDAPFYRMAEGSQDCSANSDACPPFSDE